MSILGAIGGVAGSLISGLFGNAQAKKQAALQKQFAQNQIQWKVADAKAAGVHPLAALGVTPMHYSPVSAGVPDVGPSLSSLGNAIHRTADPAERRAIDLGLEKAALENEYLRAQINSIRALRPQGPGIPSVTSSRTGQPALADPPLPEHTGLNTGAWGTTRHDRGASDAQDAENRYGESADYIEGPRNRVLDWFFGRAGMPYSAWRELWALRRAEGRDLGYGSYRRDTRQYRHR